MTMPLDHLASLLALAGQAADRPLSANVDIARIIDTLQRQVGAAGGSPIPEEAQLKAVQRFWQTPRLDSLADARLVSFGLCLPHAGEGSLCLFEDKLRFDALLKAIDRWVDDPRRFRRCYQGLVRGYFSYDGRSDNLPHTARENWARLGTYLHDRAKRIVDRRGNPEWVKAVVGHRHLFSASPCEPHAAAMLKGDSGIVDALCDQLGIPNTSWFLRELVWAQVEAATTFADDAFRAAIPDLLAMLSRHRALRDRGLKRILDRYVSIPKAPLHTSLRDAAGLWLGHPGLPSNDTRWSGVSEPAKSIAIEWFTLELIDLFFSRLSEDGSIDRRRAEFWKRYVRSIGRVHIGVHRQPLEARDGEGVAWKRKLDGITVEMHAAAQPHQALVIEVGPLVVVEFSGRSDGLFAYHTGQPLPFNLAHALQVRLDAANSLQSSQRTLCLPHRDNVPGWPRWEDLFEATLKQQFDLRPGAVWSGTRGGFVDLSEMTTDPCEPAMPSSTGKLDVQRAQAPGLGEDVHWQTAEASVVPYSRSDLEILARVHALQVEDLNRQGGKLWVLTGDADRSINRVLTRWGFTNSPGQGWWR